MNERPETAEAGRYQLEWEAEYDADGEDWVVLTATTALDVIPGWQGRVDLVLRDGRIVPKYVGASSTARHDQQLPPADVLERLGLAELGEQLEWDIRLPGVQFMLPKEWEAALAALPRRPGRRGHSLRFLAEWADQYVKAWNDSDRQGSVYKYMAEKNAGYAASTIERYVKKARDEGLLTGGGQGKGGGDLTPFCLKVLGKEV